MTNFSRTDNVDAAQALAALFDAVCVLDARGTLARVLGNPDGVEQGWIEQVRSSVADCLLGQGFETSLPGTDPNSEIEVRGVPLGAGNGALVAFRRRATSASEFLSRNMRQGLMQLDANGKIRDVNPAMASWLKTTREEMIGHSVETYLVSGKVDSATNLHREERYLGEFQTAEGIRLSASVVQKPILNAQGARIGALAMVTDLTAQHVLQAELVAELMRMTSLATRDPLTGLMNRRAFELALRQAVDRAGDEPFGVILLDLDRLKETNDELGHAAGDAALKALSDRFRQLVRESDWVGRLGGDEFAVLIQPVTESKLCEIASRVQAEMNFQIEWEGKTLQVHASAGSAHSNRFGRDVMRAADAAMYEHKHHHREHFAVVELPEDETADR